MNKKVIAYAVAGVLAVASYFVGGDVGKAIQIVTDKEAAKTYCAEVLAE